MYPRRLKSKTTSRNKIPAKFERKKGFGTAKLAVIYEMNREFSTENSALVDRSGFEPLTSTLQMWRSTN